MYLTKIMPLAALALLVAPTISNADEVTPTVVSNGPTTVVYVFPTSPQTFVPVTGLPSFLVMPGAPVPAVATQVIYSSTLPDGMAPQAGQLDLDCSQFAGRVAVAGPDVFNLDGDGDKVGCEPDER